MSIKHDDERIKVSGCKLVANHIQKKLMLELLTNVYLENNEK